MYLHLEFIEKRAKKKRVKTNRVQNSPLSFDPLIKRITITSDFQVIRESPEQNKVNKVSLISNNQYKPITYEQISIYLCNRKRPNGYQYIYVIVNDLTTNDVNKPTELSVVVWPKQRSGFPVNRCKYRPATRRQSRTILNMSK